MPPGVGCGGWVADAWSCLAGSRLRNARAQRSGVTGADTIVALLEDKRQLGTTFRDRH